VRTTVIDIEKIKKRATEIRENVEKIRKYASISDTEFWADERNILSVKHLLLESIEACGNICIHISAKKILKAASSFSECFENLADAKVVDEDLAHRLRAMSRFRNILVHRYWDVTEEKILSYARTNIGDFEDFLKSVLRYLDL
jgi:uncharacterized protein YutE (UPF0331/DUF86 family)